MKMKTLPYYHPRISQIHCVTHRTGGWNNAWKHSHRRHLSSFGKTVWTREMKFFYSLTVKTNFNWPQHFHAQPLLLNETDEFLFICEKCQLSFHLHFKYTLQNCINAVPYADKYDETMMKNYNRVSYSACMLFEWIIRNVDEHKLSLWNEHTWFAAATLFAGTHQWHLKALWNTKVIYPHFALIHLCWF